MNCYLVGTESLLVQCAETLLARGHQILGIISTAPIICQWADERRVPHYALNEEVAGVLGATPFDYLFSITNLELLPAALIELPRKLAINFHDGPLPRYAGLYATSWALLAGEQSYAVTWHRMGTRVDEGEILWQEPVPIAPGVDTALTLNTKCYEAGMRSFGPLLENLETDRIERRPQDLSVRSYFGRYRRPAGGGSIAWDQPAQAIAALTGGLDFGHSPNPLSLPKAWLGASVVTLSGVEVLATTSGAAPGTIVGVGPQRIVVATGSVDVAFSSVADADGIAGSDPISLQPGTRFITPAPTEMAGWTTRLEELARHEPFWIERLSHANPLDVPDTDPAAGIVQDPTASTGVSVDVDQAAVDALARRLPSATAADVLVAGVTLFLARATGRGSYDLAFSDPSLAERSAGVTELVSSLVPLRLAIDPASGVDTALEMVVNELQTVRTRKTFARDAVGRTPQLRKSGLQALPRTWPVRLEVGPEPGAGTAAAALHLVVDPEGRRVHWQCRTAAMSAPTLQALVHRFELFMDAAALDGERRLHDVPLISDDERRQLLIDWNATQQAFDRGACIQTLFEAQAARTPTQPALVFEDRTLDYATLNARANQVAWHLRSIGVGPDVVVGLAMERSIDMVVGVLGILKAGGAYLPLDPAYPRERLRLIIEDAQVPIVLSHQPAAAGFPSTGAPLLLLDSEELQQTLASLPGDNPHRDRDDASTLAYVIYTSGSTGEPKGVMLEHRQVSNFFTAMDGCIRHDPPGVWLAVTSLSFDISVLEIFWTLTRGFKVVLQGDQREVVSAGSRPAVSRRPLDVSLSYFASDERQQGANKYRLLLEGTKFADRHGFTAVWTPERHFHAFGGLYPNPSVISAALAAITTRISIRAGSVVLPLHHPLRVAEEWSVVDNLSGGRVGVSFASGWHPDDFVLRPEAFADAKPRMLNDIDVVRRLWRGERVPFPSPLGASVPTATLPRPVQPEMPVWITAAGNPDTFRTAGEAGTSILTHLLGQTLGELAGKIRVYRQAWRDAGHGASGGHVTLMIHTFVAGPSTDVRALVRTPMKEYLRSSVNLIKQYAWSFPATKTITASPGASTEDLFAQLSPEDLDAMLEHAFDRYFDSGGLFGTPDSCLPMIDEIKGIGVNEIACLIDFGIDEDLVLENLAHLNRLREMVAAGEPPPDDDYSIASQIDRHKVTHFQCTPSLAGVLVRDPGSRFALGTLDHMAVGGEALSPVLAEQLREAATGRLTNMYGPTETTVWSAVADITGDLGPVPIGRPIANTQIYVLDAAMQPVPPGTAGEIYIGGEGVARGYLRRPALNAERFVPDPFAGPGARLYRTGDLGRHRPDGQLEFLGRVDHQVKIRGHRVELGEVEAGLMRHPAVQDAVVIEVESPDGKRVAAYITSRGGATITPADVRTFLSERLPEYMVPSHFIVLPSLPRTPNGKIDRKALPPLQLAADPEPAAETQPHTDAEQLVAGIWQEVLHTPRVGLDQNFFDLGGHSLLTMQVLARVREATGKQLPITDMFRFPTVRALASHLGGSQDALSPSVIDGAERGASRREMLAKRRLRRV